MNKQIVNAVDAGDGDYELRVLRARLDANSQDLNARLELAGRYLKLGFREVAIEHCRLACERAPDSDEAHLALAKMLRDADRAVEAASMLSAYTGGHNTANAGVWAWLGILRDDSEDWTAGETAHRKAVALDPQRDEFHNNLGYCLLRQGRQQEAASEFRIALKLHPHSVIAENNLGLALAGRTDSEKTEAVALLQSVADPATAHNNMAVAYLEAGKYAQAQREIDIALGYNRAHQAALNNLRVLSDLEGRAAVMPRRAETEGRWAHLVRGWHRFWTHESPQNNDLGTRVASR